LTSYSFCLLTATPGTYGSQPVAVKNMIKSADVVALREFISEAELMERIPDHPNVLQFVGLVKASSGELAIVTELCPGSSLLNARMQGPLDDTQLWFVVRGIAAGMTHLAANHVTHRE
jgi:serine/threonine protein kinase